MDIHKQNSNWIICTVNGGSAKDEAGEVSEQSNYKWGTLHRDLNQTLQVILSPMALMDYLLSLKCFFILWLSKVCSVQIDGHTVETVRDFNFLGSKITAVGECSHEIKTLAPWKKNYDQPRQNIKKQKYYFANKVCLVKTMVFPVVMYGCESWTVKKAECWRIDAFELWCWRRLLKVPWTMISTLTSMTLTITVSSMWLFTKDHALLPYCNRFPIYLTRTTLT